MADDSEIVVMTITSDGLDYPDVRLERIAKSRIQKSLILQEEVNGMVLYKPDYGRITSDERMTSQVRLDFQVICDGDKNDQRTQNRRLHLWYPTSSSYQDFTTNAEAMFDYLIAAMPNDHKDYIIKVAQKMQSTPELQKIVSEITEVVFATTPMDQVETIPEPVKTEVVEQVAETVIIAEEAASPSTKSIEKTANEIIAEEKANIVEAVTVNGTKEDTRKDKLRERFRDTLLFIARVHKVMEVLQQAYPNNMSIGEVSRLSGGLGSDQITIMAIIAKLLKNGSIQEVGKSRYMKVPEGKNHEIKMVKQLPYLTQRDQPAIGIITALYCEKIAVDAMMKDKVSFVRYKTDGGESNVYTLGTIGNHRVVTTKLPTIGMDRSARISSGNTVTRLLGTFNQIDHVILVGVAGAVPDSDMALGDIVVSLPMGADSPQYVACDNVIDEDHTGEVNFNVRNWASTDETMSRVSNKMEANAPTRKSKDQPFAPIYNETLEILRKEQEQSHFLSYERPMSDIDFPSVHFGVIGGGKPLMMDKNVRREFAKMTNVLAFDHHFDIIMDAIVGSRKDSFILVRGISDYVDGWEQSRWSGIAKWQPAAALAAAAFAKSLILNYRPRTDQYN